MKKIVVIGFIALLYPVYGEEPFTCVPERGDIVVYCNDFNSPNNPSENTGYGDMYNYNNSIYSGTGSARYISQRSVEIVGLNLTAGATANTNGIYKDGNDANNKYALGLFTSPNQAGLSRNSDIMGFVFDVKDPQGNIYDNIRVEFDVAPGFLTNGTGSAGSLFHIGGWPIWSSTDPTKVSIALFDGEQALSDANTPAFPPPPVSNALVSDLLIGGTTEPYSGSLTAPIQDYPVNFTKVETTLSTKGLVDPDGKVTLMLSFDNSSYPAYYGFIDNLKVITTNRANPNSASAIPSLTFMPLLALMGLFGWMTSYRLKRR